MRLYRIKSIYFTTLVGLKRKLSTWDPTIDSDIAQKFVAYSNKYYLKKFKNQSLKGTDILVLMPHCIQNFECPYKVTSYIENCKKCGKCKIEKLLELKERYGVHVKIATGGTLARKILKETRPSCVIAVACERDLISGIYDIYPLPVYGIFNSRPNGPCVSTDVNIDEVEQTIKSLIGE